MFLVSGPELVVAACKAGIVGSFPTASCRTESELSEWMNAIVAGLGEADSCVPWAANLVTHSTNGRLSGHLDLVAQYKPPIVVTALGSPKPVIDIVHAYGGLVIADVPDLKLARKAVDAGADGLACIAAGAGGHTGYLSPFSFIASVREFFDGLLIVGGGIAEGAGIAGAVAAGADLVYVGTRFLASVESRASAAYKRMVVECGTADLVVSAALTGSAASWLKPSLDALGINLDTSVRPEFSGRARWRDIWSAGQGLQVVRSIEPVGTIVEELAAQYAEAVSRFGRVGEFGRSRSMVQQT